MRYLAGEEGQLPAVGDWVVIVPQVNEKTAIIRAMIPRKSRFSRKVAGEETKEQVVAANVDSGLYRQQSGWWQKPQSAPHRALFNSSMEQRRVPCNCAQ